MKRFYVYIMSSRSGVLYVGMTNDLRRRVAQHKSGLVPGFTASYHVNRLVYHEWYPTALKAIAVEKQIKGWTRAKKIALIESENPRWQDLSEESARPLAPSEMPGESEL